MEMKGNKGGMTLPNKAESSLCCNMKDGLCLSMDGQLHSKLFSVNVCECNSM